MTYFFTWRRLLFMLCTAGPGLSPAWAQVGIGTATPDPSAALDVQSPTASQGLLTPRLTRARR